MSDGNKILIRELLSAIDRNDWDAAESYFAPDAVIVLAGTPTPLDPTGFRQFGETFFRAVRDGRHTVEEQVAEGDRVTTRLTFAGTQTGELMCVPPTGRRISIGAVNVDRVIDGKIVGRYLLFDTLSLLQQIGAIPTQAQAAA